MYNSPFKDKNIDYMNGRGKATTANAMMNPGPGDPPKKKGTATTVTSEDKLKLAASKFESMQANINKPGSGITGKQLQKQREFIETLPGGINYLDENTGGVMQTSKGKKITLREYSQNKGVSEEEGAGDLMRQAIQVQKSKKKQK